MSQHLSSFAVDEMLRAAIRRSVADKLTRALKWAPLAEEGKIILVKGAWNKDFLDEVCLFPSGQFDDQVDAISIAVAMYGARNRNAWFF